MMPGSGNINDSVNENSEEEGLFEGESMKQSEQRSKPSKERHEMIKRKIEMYIDKIIEISEERSDSIMFLLYLAGVDKSKIIFNHLKANIRKILGVLK